MVAVKGFQFLIRWAMDDTLALERFRRQEIIAIDQLVELLTYSVITARRRLNKW